jgi:hypothetical protein
MTRILLCVLACLLAHPAYAYRPFNSTDAAVAKPGEMELEWGPLGYVVDADGRFLVVPSAILNFGIADGWELVIEGRNFLLVQPVSVGRRDTLRETALSLKGVLRQGSLQERTGPSVALEVGLLLPGVRVDPGFGASVTGIVSQRWSAMTLHVNGTFLVTHDHSLGAFAGAILEGPLKWAIRPVAEVMMDEDSGRTISGLVGAIWQVRGNLSLDLGWRVGESQGADVREIRAGFTWAVPLKSHSEATPTGPLSVPPRWKPRS